MVKEDQENESCFILLTHMTAVPMNIDTLKIMDCSKSKTKLFHQYQEEGQTKNHPGCYL